MKSKILHDNYVVYLDGRVHSRYTNKYLKYNLISSGYLSVKLHVEGKAKPYLVHRLIMWVDGELEDLNDTELEVDHKDRIRTNNSRDNLKVLTKKEHKIKSCQDRGFAAPTFVKYYCALCNVKLPAKAKLCRVCYTKERQPKSYSSKEEITDLFLQEGSWEAAGRKAGISGNGLRKRYKKFGDPKELKKLL